MTSILFVLPVSGGSGGAHSVMQEADALRRMGVDARIATNQDNAVRLKRTYRDLPGISAHVLGYDGDAGLGELIVQQKPNVVVATTNRSVHNLAAALRLSEIKGQRTAYYVQDYEPFFYERDSADWLTAYTSFGLIPGMVHFAKTRWLQEIVQDNHQVQVWKVEPSIDHAVYFPDFAQREDHAGSTGAAPVLRLVAMLRPGTARRAPRRTVRIMNRIAAEMGAQVQCTTFGCTDDQLKAHSLRLASVRHKGILEREDVGDLFRGTDLFLDLSDFQAFGRTAIEAMSCGASAVVPAHGGTYEYAEDGRNAFIVDTRDDDAILAAVRQFVAMNPVERREMMMRGVEAGYRYTPEKAALSEIEVLSE